MGPGSITRYARPARLWRIGTEHSPRSIVRHDGKGVDALRMCTSASSLSSMAMRATGSYRANRRHEASLGFSGSRWGASVRLAWAEPRDERPVAIMCRRLEKASHAVSDFLLLPPVASRRLGLSCVGCDPNQPSR